MSRSLTAAMIAELAAGHVRPVLFVEAEFASGTLHLWTGVGTISWDSQTWTGAGKLLSITPVQETADLRANGVTIALSGVDPAILSAVLTDVRQGKPVSVWLGFLDAAGAVIADPYRKFVGRVDVPTIEPGPETITVSITVENRLVDLQRLRTRRYTAEEQKKRFPGDLGFDYVASLQNVQIQWGTAYLQTPRPSLVIPPFYDNNQGGP